MVETRSAATVQALNKLYYADPITHGMDGVFMESKAKEESHTDMQSYEECMNMPLWRVQWAVLPGFQELLHVHVPHYCDMFGRILAGPKPWRFGHVYLPGGSASMSDPQYALRPGTQAPLVGVVMEIENYEWMPDGRLFLQATAIGKMRVLEVTQEQPYSRANVEWLPDNEEVESFERDMTEVAASVMDDPEGEGDVIDVMAAAAAAARAAAIASAQVWSTYENPPPTPRRGSWCPRTGPPFAN